MGKSPNINYHLAGTKKVQQVLAQPGVVEKLLGDETKAKILRDSFTGLYSLDLNEEGDRAAEMAMKDPERFVLKPQREGGGNNVYGKEVKDTLEKLNGTPERAGYILMDVIQPPLIRNCVIRPGKTFHGRHRQRVGHLRRCYRKCQRNIPQLGERAHVTYQIANVDRRRCSLWVRLFRFAIPYRLIATIRQLIKYTG